MAEEPSTFSAAVQHDDMQIRKVQKSHPGTGVDQPLHCCLELLQGGILLVTHAMECCNLPRVGEPTCFLPFVDWLILLSSPLTIILASAFAPAAPL